MKNSYVSKKIAELTRIATIDIPNLLKTGYGNVPIETYDSMRYALNCAIIEALTGGELSVKDGKVNIKFSHRLPNKADVYVVAGIVDNFVLNVENPYLASFIPVEDVELNENDMAIPPMVVVTDDTLGDISKLKNKVLKEAILGANGEGGLTKIHLAATDCLAIAAAAEVARKKANRNKFFIIGGVALAVVGVGVAAAVIAKNKKKDDADTTTDELDIDDIDTDDIDVDIDDIDAPSVDLDDTTSTIDLDDTPTVDLD